MLTGILRRVNVTSLVVVIALFVMSGGAYAAKGPSSSGKTVLGGSSGLTVSFPGALTATPAFVPASPALTRDYQSSFGSFPASGDPQALTVDQSTGDVYAVSPGAGTVSRFTSAGAPENFTAGPDAGTNALTGFSFDGPAAAEVAIAPAAAVGGTAGDIYVASFAGIDVYANDGTHLGQITQANGAGFSESCGVTTDNTGRLYVGDFGGNIDRYVPSANPVTNTGYDAQITGASSPCNVAADSTGAVYASTWPTGPLTKHTASDFGTSNAGTVIDASSRAVSVDPSTDDVYVDEGNKISVFDPAGTSLYTFGSSIDFGSESAGVAVTGSGGNAYVADPSNNQIDVYGPPVPVPPEVSIAPATAITNTTTTINGSVDPQGFALSDCHFEYANETDFLTKGFTGAAVAPCDPVAGAIPADLDDHSVSADISGLDRNTTYHYRLHATSAQGTSVTSDATFTTTGPAEVETVGSPTRTSTTAQLEGRLDPRSAPTSYHFEYGDHGPCDSNPCAATTPRTAGSGDLIEFVSQQVTGLQANTTYHYRLIADNGNTDGPSAGTDHTLTTRNTDAPLTHGHFSGPPNSDRAWEQVSIPDTGGNRVTRSLAISDNGERAVYSIDGGSPGSQYGGGLGGHNDQYAERTPSGWQNKSFYPTRAQAPGNEWLLPLEEGSDLSQLYAIGLDQTGGGSAEIWHMSPGAPAQRVLSVPYSRYQFNPGFTVVSANGLRVLAVLIGNFDPAHPVGPEDEELYDVTTGTPHMVGLLPDGSVPSCGVHDNYMNPAGMSRTQGWVTPDGSHAFFSSCSSPTASHDGLFVRDLINSTTVQLAANARFIRSTDGVAFFTTEESLAAGDKGGNDIYRYTIQDGRLDCLTCSTAAAGSVVSDEVDEITDYGTDAVSDDGTRVYFRSAHRLLPGASNEGIYRLDVPGRDLAYVAPAEGARSGDYGTLGNAINTDGSVFIFQSNNPALSAVNGAQNGGTLQDYRYDDTDRSLVCVSCPGDGSLPRGPMFQGLEGPPEGSPGSALTGNGDLVFVTPTPLVSSDQNTALPSQDPTTGDDVYEWRDGRLLLVTDGQTFNIEPPRFAGASRSGRDIFFIQGAQLTPDAIDSQLRLYDARIGGGFDFPQPPAPCSLEACQGNPSSPPNDQTPGSESFSGPGNQAKSQVPPKQCGSGQCVKSQPHKRCVKGKVLKHGKCLKKRQHKRAKRAKRVSYNHGGAK